MTGSHFENHFFVSVFKMSRFLHTWQANDSVTSVFNITAKMAKYDNKKTFICQDCLDLTNGDVGILTVNVDTYRLINSSFFTVICLFNMTHIATLAAILRGLMPNEKRISKSDWRPLQPLSQLTKPIPKPFRKRHFIVMR